MPSNESHYHLGQSVGAKIRKARLSKKYTQSQLARPDFSVSYISAIERGQIHPSLRALEIIANRLDLSSKELIPDATETPTSSSTRSESTISEEEIELELLEARIFIRQGQPSQAITLLRNLHEKFYRSLNPRQQIDLYYLLGLAYLTADQFQESEDALTEAVQLTKDPSGFLRLHILSLLGVVYASLQNYSQALEIHQDCLTQLEQDQFQNPFLKAEIYTELGQDYMHLNRSEDAVEMLQRALALTEGLAGVDQLETVYWNLSQNYAAQDEYQRAELEAYKILFIEEQKANTSLMSETYHYLGEAMMKENPEEAYAFFEEALHKESVMRNALACASVNDSMAEWLLVHNEVTEAERYAQRARELAAPTGESIILGSILLTFGRIEYARKQYDAGDADFEAGLRMLEDLADSEDFAEQSFRYAGLLEGRGKTQEAFQYIKRAYESLPHE